MLHHCLFIYALHNCLLLVYYNNFYAYVITAEVETTTWGDTTTVAETTTIATTTPVETTTGEHLCFITVCLLTHYITVSFTSIIIIFMIM